MMALPRPLGTEYTRTTQWIVPTQEYKKTSPHRKQHNQEHLAGEVGFRQF